MTKSNMQVWKDGTSLTDVGVTFDYHGLSISLSTIGTPKTLIVFESLKNGKDLYTDISDIFGLQRAIEFCDIYINTISDKKITANEND